jgi:hypothetical protein
MQKYVFTLTNTKYYEYRAFPGIAKKLNFAG